MDALTSYNLQSAHEVFIKEHNRARVVFASLVNSFIDNETFQRKIIALIEKHPWYLPAYLEVLELLERLGCSEDYRDFLALSWTRIFPIFRSPENIRMLANVYDFQELLSLGKLLQRLNGSEERTFFRAPYLLRAQYLTDTYREQKIPAAPKKNVVCLNAFIQVDEFKRELQGKEHHWFSRSDRQQHIISHVHTQAILLRNNRIVSTVPVPADGPHESLRKAQAAYFQKIVTFAETFALQNQLGLGRVALVRLRPKKLVYRHCDTEENLKDRLRFHLIISAKETNMLILGDEVAVIGEGQLWQYGNKTMHKSYNESDDWRVNLIFDAFPDKTLRS